MHTTYNFTNIGSLATLAMLAAATVSGCAYNGNSGGSIYSDDEYAASSSAPAKKKASDPRIKGPIQLTETSIGKVIAGGPDGKTLYTFANDSGSISACYDACAAAWPPFIAANPALATDSLTVTGRSDGSIQWVFDGKPLYFWAGDTKEGETSGAGIPNWSVAKP